MAATSSSSLVLSVAATEIASDSAVEKLLCRRDREDGKAGVPEAVEAAVP